MFHKLAYGLDAIRTCGEPTMELTPETIEFIDKLDSFGGDHHLAGSNYAFSSDLIELDRAVWELRRFCTLEPEPRQSVLTKGEPAPKVSLHGGHLEQIIAAPQNPAREPLLWQNCFFGRRVRRKARPSFWIKATNAPLHLNPEILEEVIRFVRLPRSMESAYRDQKKF